MSDPNKYYQFNDGWFTYYVNTKTGQKKFELEEGDTLVDSKLDDFITGYESNLPQNIEY